VETIIKPISVKIPAKVANFSRKKNFDRQSTNDGILNASEERLVTGLPETVDWSYDYHLE
jgi:hypothetical protein